MADYAARRKELQELADKVKNVKAEPEIKLIAESLANLGSVCAALLAEVESLGRRVAELERKAAKGPVVK